MEYFSTYLFMLECMPSIIVGQFMPPIMAFCTCHKINSQVPREMYLLHSPPPYYSFNSNIILEWDPCMKVTKWMRLILIKVELRCFCTQTDLEIDLTLNSECHEISLKASWIRENIIRDIRIIQIDSVVTGII